ncbi:aromatic prenyltransferase [Streptomyces sp. WMMC500]|uniref:aromatic prenyltransferase n=1 Tax=Streptomyces sp. WMMC500 TaxID=3015154 RepID=UPI00248ACC61|nr:aromatic prenyltransferase [Streptomyces sp. WMMC500]WBB61660.1 aromatic prenyltransferase [Streptomyces sp. WMMC500]
MPEATKLETIYSAVEESARLVEAPCTREKVWPALDTFGQWLDDAHIIFSMGSGERYRGELAFDFILPAEAGDPYAAAVAGGLLDKTDHPIGGLLPEIADRFPIDGYGVDFGIVGGFRKAVVFFPIPEPQSMRELAKLPSMPPGLAEHAESFAAAGLDGKVSAIGVDHRSRSWNLYISGLTPEFTRPDAVRATVRDMGLPEPSERMLEFISTSFAMYPSFRWDSTRIERICFSTRTSDPDLLPSRSDPRVATFARDMPTVHGGEPRYVYAGTVAPGEEFFKLAGYYQLSSQVSERVRPAD